MGFLLVRGWITLTVTTSLLLVIDAFFAPSSRSIYGIQHSLNPLISFHCSQGSRIKRRLTEEDISVNRGQDEADIVVIGSGIAGWVYMWWFQHLVLVIQGSRKIANITLDGRQHWRVSLTCIHVRESLIKSGSPNVLWECFSKGTLFRNYGSYPQPCLIQWELAGFGAVRHLFYVRVLHHGIREEFTPIQQ